MKGLYLQISTVSETRRAGYKVGKNSEIFSHFM